MDIKQYRLIELNRKHLAAKLISRKQLIAYGWQARDGSIFEASTGQRIYTDRIMNLQAKLMLNENRKVKSIHSQLVAYRNRIDGFIYFNIGAKSYKTPAIVDIESK